LITQFSEQQVSQVPPNMINTEACSISPEKLPQPPPGMRYDLVPEQQPSSISPQPTFQAQQQPIGVHQCYTCGAVAVQRCFFGTNGPNHCKKMMCLAHAESTMQGPPWGTYYYCQEHHAAYLASRNGCCSIL
jgi:hypothetical protein